MPRASSKSFESNDVQYYVMQSISSFQRDSLWIDYVQRLAACVTPRLVFLIPEKESFPFSNQSSDIWCPPQLPMLVLSVATHHMRGRDCRDAP